MKVTEEDLRRLYEESTVPSDAAGCLGTDVLIRAAENRLGDAERETVADHIARCSECARGYRIARSMRALTDSPSRPSRPVWAFAAGAVAAMLLLFVPSAIRFNRLREHDRTTIAALQNTLAERDRRTVVAPTADLTDFTRPQLDTPIIDLDADVVRGTAKATSVVVPANVDLFTAILHLDQPAPGANSITIDIAIEGPARWNGSWRAVTPAATLPLTLHRKRFPSGAYVVRTRGGGHDAVYRFRVDWR
jgi:hypothetical protein